MLLNYGVGEDSWKSARRSNQSIIKEISPEYSLEGVMRKLKLNTLATWCRELTHWGRPWWWKRLKAEEEGSRGWDDSIASPNQWTWICTHHGSGGKRSLACCSPWGHRVRHNWATELNSLTRSSPASAQTALRSSLLLSYPALHAPRRFPPLCLNNNISM